MEISIIKLLPKEWKIIKQRKKIKVYYQNKGRGNSPKPMILNKTLKITPKFIESWALYLGDGKISKDEYHLEFTSRDIDLCQNILHFFEKYFGINKNKISYTLRTRKIKKDSLKNWQNYLALDDSKIRLKASRRHKNECLAIQVGSRILRTLFLELTKQILKSKFTENSTLRKAFLSGLFAAEGSINTMKKENYIVYMGYHLSLIKEKKLAELIKSCLEKEAITSTLIERKDKNEILVQITSWSNYWKMFNKGIICLSERKKKTILNHMKQMTFYFQVSEKFKKTLLSGTNKRKLAKELDMKYLTLYYQFRNNLINKSVVLRLSEINKIPRNKIISNISGIKGKTTKIINNKNFVSFIFDL